MMRELFITQAFRRKSQLNCVSQNSKLTGGFKAFNCCE